MKNGSVLILLVSLLVISIIAGCGSAPPGGGNKGTPPAAPGALVVTPGDEQLAVTWDPVSGATSYQVWYGTTNDSSIANRFGGDINDCSCTITGLTNDTLYYVWIKAKNSAGISPFSTVGSGTPTGGTALGAPGTPALTAGSGILNVNWPAVPDAYFYEVYYSVNNNSASATKFLGDPNDSDTFCQIYGLTNGTGYYVWLKAKRSENNISAFSPMAYETPKAEPAATVYSTGTYIAAGKYLPCYWQVATRYDLPLPLDYGPDYICSANSIFVVSGTPYIAGFYKSFGCNYACYWVNTGSGIDRHYVDGGQTVNSSVVSSAANSVYVSGTNTVYIAGNCSSAGLGGYYWTGGVKYDLEGGANSTTNSIYVSGSTVYNAGYLHDFSTAMDNPCYWTGTVKTDLGDGVHEGYATAIFVAGGVVYTAGYYYDGVKYIPCYWVGITRHDLPGSVTFSSNNYLAPANSIFVTGGKVYVGGYYSRADGPTYTNI
ncbi:MAG TPA: fibronectin type III domain-containing protein, partial [Bacillota bacterium]|nr:fibronectin type III domain-containing protein [Bacillota bacterium]